MNRQRQRWGYIYIKGLSEVLVKTGFTKELLALLIIILSTHTVCHLCGIQENERQQREERNHAKFD